jgi:xylulokinase
MRKDRYILALDIGTSSLKAGIFDRNDNLVLTDKEDYEYETIGMHVQMDPEKIWRAFLKVARKVSDYLDKVELIVQCVLSPSLIPMDESGNPLYPSIIHWDRRSVKQARKALAIIGKERFLALAGNLPYPGGISLTGLLWIKEKEPEIFKKAFQFGHMNTFFLKRLTGNWSIDPTNASLTGLYHTVSRSGWIEDFAREFEIPIEKLPPVIQCLDLVGKVTREVSSVTGIKSGTPVLMGSNDTSSAALGAGVIENGQILNISGSGELCAVCLDKPIPDEKYYLRTHPLPNRWLIFDLTTGGFALEWFRSQFCREINEDAFYHSYLPVILTEKRKTTVKFLSHLAGDRTSLKQKRASFSGLTLDTSREDCLCAISEAILDRTKNLLNKTARKIELDRTIYLTGGRVNQALLDYKKSRLPGFEIVVKDDCALYGCAAMARKLLKNF